jgi:hypothetical protein
MASINLWGWKLGKDEDIVTPTIATQPSLVLKQEQIDDGAITITQGAHVATYVDLEGSVRNEIELISRYREMALHPECSMAIDEIVTEAITQEPDGDIVDINLDKLEGASEGTKKKITDEFATVKRLLNFNNLADEIFRRWYVDGRIYYEVIVDRAKPTEGIQELRFIDPRKIRKVREILKERDPKTGAEIIKSTAEYYMYNDRGTVTQTYTAHVNQGIRIAPDAIININSGMMDAKNVMVISWLHKAIKPLNQLRMIEDAVVIYRLSRAPERRIFYIDVGNLPKLKAEQYVRDIMIKYRNKLVYDASTGELRDERKHLSMLEDFWLPRREGSKGTEITTLPAGQNLGQMEDVLYFQKKLYQCLNVPIGRLDPSGSGTTGQGGFAGIGRVAEVTRDEVKFSKFVNILRKKFSMIFYQALKRQLSLKGICSVEEWEKIKEVITFKYATDNNFAEMRDSELLRERMATLGLVEPYVGTYFSRSWVRKNVLMQSDEEIEEMDKEIAEEPPPVPPAMDGMGGPGGAPGQPGAPGGVPGQPGQPGMPEPEDNSQETLPGQETESPTPMLDKEVAKGFGKGKSINKLRGNSSR